MANGTIFDQTQETALTAAHRVLVQETSAATASTSATFGLMGGLETNNQTVTTTDITGAVGQLYVCTISGLTAVRNLTLPSAQVGERIGVYIEDGDATYALVIKGAASQTINGGTAATEWSRLFIQGECCVFRCVAANTWIVEYDGRVPCVCELEAAASQTLATSGGWEDIDFNTGEDNFDVGGIFDDTINSNRGGFTIRRGNKYSTNMYYSASVEDQKLYGVSLKVNGTQIAGLRRVNMYASHPTLGVMRTGIEQLGSYSTGDTVGMMGIKSWSTGDGDVQCVFSIREIL